MSRGALPRVGLPVPRAIGVDEMASRKGHHYRLAVSDLDRPIWVGGKGRTEANCDFFFAALGVKKMARIQLAAIDRWNPFRTSLNEQTPFHPPLLRDFEAPRVSSHKKLS